MNKEKQLLYKWTPPCEHALTSGFIWPLGPKHFPASTWLLLQTCPSLNVYKRGKSPPFFLSTLPLTKKGKKKKLDPMIHSFSFSVLHQDVSHTKMDPVFHSVINQVQSLWVSLHFPALGNRVITKKQETSRFLSPNYHCMTVKWV